jgi:hypothetical protein
MLLVYGGVIVVSIYLARGMTGRNKAEVVLEAKADKEFFEKCGLKVLDPVSSEGVKSENMPIQSTKTQMDQYWRRDKQMIREAHVVLDMTPHLKSEGVWHELGYARYHLWKKIIRVYSSNELPPETSAAFYEDDAIVETRIMAVESILRTHGTLWKRLKWRAALYQRCWLRAFWHRIGEWK